MVVCGPLRKTPNPNGQLEEGHLDVPTHSLRSLISLTGAGRKTGLVPKASYTEMRGNLRHFVMLSKSCFLSGQQPCGPCALQSPTGLGL